MDDYASALKAWLEGPDRSQAALAEAIGSTQPSIHRYATGERFPERNIAERIDLATAGDVAMALWQRVALARIGIDSAEAA
jgi:hypothetical protein